VETESGCRRLRGRNSGRWRGPLLTV